MKRWVWFWIWALLGVCLLAVAWAIPVYVRAVDVAVLQKAGQRTPTLVDRGLQLVKDNRLGAAELLLQAAREEGLPERAELGLAVTNLAKDHPEFRTWGGGEPHLTVLFGTGSKPVSSATASTDSKLGGQSLAEPLTDWIVRLENRDRVLELLAASPRPAVQELMRCRSVTNTVLFSPSRSASGQAFDAALSICGLLLSEDKLNAGLSNVVFSAELQATRGGNPQPLEELLLDFLSLGQRFNWGQLTAFVAHVQDANTFGLLTNLTRRAGDQLPLLFSAVDLSGNPSGVAQYLSNFSRTGMKDLAGGLRERSGGLNELLRRQARLYGPGWRESLWRNTPLGAAAGFAVDYAWRSPEAALAIKWFLYLTSGFLLAMALHFAWPPLIGLEAPLRVRGLHFARETLFALGFLVVVLLLSEPFLAQESQKADFAFRLRLPTVGTAIATGANRVKSSFMDPKSLLTLLLFFVLQALLYTACLVKLAEIRRQRVPPRVKLRLLENEDHLFDAGLYLGFAGTIVSLILVSLGIIKQSLMAAYSSTSFGIIFVSVFKIFNLRPVRRKLLLEAESESIANTPAPAPAGRAMAAPL